MYDASYILKDKQGRVIPAGYTDNFDSTISNVGNVFRYHDVCRGWDDCDIMVAVDPYMTVEAAYEGDLGEPLPDDCAIFFVSDE